MVRYTRANSDSREKISWKQKFACLALGLVCIAITVITFAPAAWLSIALENQTEGKFALGDVQGNLWNGSAFIGVSSSKDGDLTPLLPGRFTWKLSRILLLGQIELQLENNLSLKQPLHISGNLRHVVIDPSAIILPSERLSGLGAPLNTIKPVGELTLSWDTLSLERLGKQIDVNGMMNLTMQNISSALSKVKPLGSYAMTFLWHGQTADIELKTVDGPMLLSGKGELTDGRLHFNGQAQAQEGQEENLAGLLNLLGQRRGGADNNVIALVFN